MLGMRISRSFVTASPTLAPSSSSGILIFETREAQTVGASRCDSLQLGSKHGECCAPPPSSGFPWRHGGEGVEASRLATLLAAMLGSMLPRGEGGRPAH